MNIKHLTAIYSILEQEKGGALNTLVAEKLGVASSTSSKYLCTLHQLKVINSERRKIGNVYSLKEGVTFDEAKCHSCKQVRPLSRINLSCECFVCSRGDGQERPVKESKEPGYEATTDMTKIFDGEQPDWNAVFMLAKNRKINRLQMSM
ncbi:hypothetical protein [Vibrio europaeus]|uniref:hypothetical protein n=1 Tax=Vibrio europaeus TaxID=300876 RepID=UPI00233EFF4B|nr:hypothetical protein [Vibrio europaeus]MDC5753581.1 hypothetical protein [Vibrio europaeus]MDC5816506.1 hypothetical protein [Vibrio europaeus]